MPTRALLILITLSIGAILTAGCTPKEEETRGRASEPQILTIKDCSTSELRRYEPCVTRVSKGHKHIAARWAVLTGGKDDTPSPPIIDQCPAGLPVIPCLEVTKTGGRTILRVVGVDHLPNPR